MGGTCLQCNLFFMLTQNVPYMMVTSSRERQRQYSGYIKDLLDALVARMGADYELYQVPDNNFGSLRSDRTWDGMINELLQGVSSKLKDGLFECFLYVFSVDSEQTWQQDRST